MIAYYGLNEKIGNLSYYDSTGQQEYSFTRPYSEKTAQMIDEEVHNLIDKAYKNAKSILEKHKENLGKLANQLLEKEVIFNDDLLVIFGKRSFEPEEHILETEYKEEIIETENETPKPTKQRKTKTKNEK